MHAKSEKTEVVCSPSVTAWVWASVVLQQAAFVGMALTEIELIGLPAWTYRFPFVLVWICSWLAPLSYVPTWPLPAFFSRLAKVGWLFVAVNILASVVYLKCFDIGSLARANYEYSHAHRSTVHGDPNESAK